MLGAQAPAPMDGGALPEDQQAAKRPRTEAGSPLGPASGGSGTSASTLLDTKPMPIARFDPSLVAAVKCATAILQSDDGWSKEEAAATIAVLASKFQNSKRRTATTNTSARSGEANSQQISQQQPQQPQPARQAGLQEQSVQSGLHGNAAAGAAGFGLQASLYPQQQQQQAGLLGREQQFASAGGTAAGWQGLRLSSLLPSLGSKTGAQPTGTGEHGTDQQQQQQQQWPNAAAWPQQEGMPGSSPAVAAFAAASGGQAAAAAGGLGAGGAGPAAAGADQPHRRSASLDAISGSTAGQSQPGVLPHGAQAPAAAGAAGQDSKGVQNSGYGPVVSGFGSVPGSPCAQGANAAAAGPGQPQQQQEGQQAQQPAEGGGAPALTAGVTGRRTLDAASAAAVAAAAKAASKIAATAAATSGLGGDILSPPDAGANRNDQALRLPGDLGAVPGTASSPLAAVGSSSCAEASVQRQASGNGGEAAATSAEAGMQNASQQGLSGSLEDILAHVGAQPGTNGQLQLPLALMQLLQSGQPQALPLMSALLRSGNLRPLVADALKVRLSTYLQQQQQQQQQQGLASSAGAAAGRDVAGAATDGAHGGADGPGGGEGQQRQQPVAMAASSDSRSIGSTAAGSQASADPGPVETTKRKRGQQPAAAKAAAAAERPRKRQARGAAAAAAAAAEAEAANDDAAAAAAAPEELTATGRPKRGRAAKGAKAAAAAAAAAAEAADAADDAAAAASSAVPAAADLAAMGSASLGRLGSGDASLQASLAAARFHHLQQQQFGQQQKSLQFKQLGGLSALLAEEEAAAAAAAAAGKQALAQGSLLQQRQSQSMAGAGAATPSMLQDQQPQQPAAAQQQQEPQYNTSSIADCPELLLRLRELPAPAVQQVLDMASKLPEDMPQKWKQTVLLQAAESAANVFRLQNPQQQQQQQFGGSAVAAAEPAAAQNLASPAAAGSKTATPAPDAATVAAVADVEPSPAATPSAGQQQDGDVLPGLLAAAQNHPQLRSMPPDKREALLKQLLQQHQAKRLSQQGSMLEPSRAGYVGAGGMDWAVFGQQSQQGGSGAMTSLGMSPGLAGAGGADLLWQMAGMSGSSSHPGGQKQQQLGRAGQTPRSASLGRFGGLPGELQPGSGMGTNDPAFQAALGGGPGGAAGAGGFSDVFDAAGGLGGAGGSSSDGSNIFAGLMGGIGPEMRAQYMKKLQAQLELHGMNKKQLVENIKAKGALAALKSIGMLASDLGAGAAGAGAGAADGGNSQAAGAAAAAVAAAAAGGMDPAMAAAMPSDAAFAAMRQQALQQQLSLGPSQQAWLQHQNQQAAAAAGLGCSGMTDGSMNALLAQQQWHGMMGLQQQHMAGGYPNLLGPSLYGMDGLGPSTGAGSLSGVGGMQLDPLGGLLRCSAQQQAMLMQQQQHHHAMAFSSGMVGPYQHSHGSLGMLAAQQQLMYQQQQLAGMGPGMGSAAGTAGMPWGCMGMGGMQQPVVGSSAALDPPVLELPNLSPIKTGAAAAMAGPASAGAAAGGSAFAAATAPAAPAAAPAPGAASAAAAAEAPARRSSQAGAPARSTGSAGQQQQRLQPLELPGSLTELGGPEDDAIAMSPFGQLGLNAADVDALLSGFEPSGLMGLMAQGEEPGNSNPKWGG